MRAFLSIALLTGLIVALPVQAVVIEDFEDNDISNWIAEGPNVNVYTSTGAAHDGNYGMVFEGVSGGEDWVYRADAGVTVSQGDVIGYWTKTMPFATTRNYMGFGSSAGGTYSCVIGLNTADLMIQLNVGYGYSTIGSTPYAGWQNDKWYYVEVVWDVGGGITGYCYDSDGSTLLVSVNAFDNTYTTGGIAFRSFDSGEAACLDTVTRNGGATPVEQATWGGIKASFK